MKIIKIADFATGLNLAKVSKAREPNCDSVLGWMQFLILDKDGVIFASDKKRAHILKLKDPMTKELKDLKWLKKQQVFAIYSGSNTYGEGGTLTVLDNGPLDVCKKLVDYKSLFFLDDEDYEAVTAKNFEGDEVVDFSITTKNFDKRVPTLLSLLPQPISLSYLRDLIDNDGPSYVVKLDMLEDPEKPVLFEQDEFTACVKTINQYIK